MRRIVLRVVATIIGLIQIFFGIGFSLFPSQLMTMLGYSPIPTYLAGLAGARFLAMAAAMALVVTNPVKYALLTWIMVGVQTVDVIVAIIAVINGAPLGQMMGAIVLPALWVVLLSIFAEKKL